MSAYADTNTCHNESISADCKQSGAYAWNYVSATNKKSEGLIKYG